MEQFTHKRGNFFFSKCYTIFFLEIRNITLSFSQDGLDHTCMLYTMLYCLAHLFCHLNYKIPFVIQNACAQWKNEPDAIFKHESKMKIEFWCCYHNYCLTMRTMIKNGTKNKFYCEHNISLNIPFTSSFIFYNIAYAIIILIEKKKFY